MFHHGNVTLDICSTTETAWTKIFRRFRDPCEQRTGDHTLEIHQHGKSASWLAGIWIIYIWLVLNYFSGFANGLDLAGAAWPVVSCTMQVLAVVKRLCLMAHWIRQTKYVRVDRDLVNTLCTTWYYYISLHRLNVIELFILSDVLGQLTVSQINQWEPLCDSPRTITRPPPKR